MFCAAGHWRSSRFVIGDDSIEEHADVRIADRLDVGQQLRPHLVDRARRRQHAVFFAKALQTVLRRIDAPHVRHRQLQLSLKDRAVTFDAHELAGLELVAESLDVVDQLCGNLAGGILQGEQQDLAVAHRPQLAYGAEKVAPALRVRRDWAADPRQAAHCHAAAEREGHRAVRDDPSADPRAPGEHAHAAAQPLDQRFDLDHVAGVHRAAIAHLLDAHEEDQAVAILRLREDEDGADLRDGLGENRRRQRRSLAVGRRREIALVDRDVLDADDPSGRARTR